MTKYIDVEPLKTEIKKLAEEITRLLTENKELKERVEKANRTSLHGGRIAGQNEAWELTRKIILNNGYSVHDLYEIFGYADSQTLMKNHTYQEAAAKVAEWEKAKEEIKDGDVLEGIYDNNLKCIVTNLYTDNIAYLVFDDGTAGFHELDNFKKTGRHIDIDSFLKQIGGAK